MAVYELIAVLVIVAVAIKVFEERIPVAVYRFGTLLYVTVPFVGLVIAIWTTWGEWIGGRELTLFLVFAFLTGIGTGVGYHRLLTHHSFETRPSIKFVLLALGAMALPTRPVDFAANHLKHHAFSDRDGDPHSPLDGLFHAHLGWIFKASRPDRERYCGKLLNDRVVMFVDRTPMVWFGLGLLIPYLIAGWPGLLWGGLIRLGYHNHVTFAVNSICHTFGDRPFATSDESRNNWIVGLLAFGEGWHNNHHAFPGMAYHGLGWRQVDLNALVIRGLAGLRLAWNVKQPSPELIARRRREPTESAPPAAEPGYGDTLPG
jgi:stearoyl-CoA desaturase (delta-9 desaturase)